MIGGFDHERFVRFMAPYFGLWREIGALEDPRLLRRLRRARRALGLPPDYHLAAQGSLSRSTRKELRGD
jgi:hypothetical protein